MISAQETHPPSDIDSCLDAGRVSRLQWIILAACFLVLAADGLDTVLISYVGPALMREWSLTKLELGPLFSSALIGAAIGALISGPIADVAGRKHVIISALASFGILSLVGAFASTLNELIVIRFLAGLGLGAAMPNAATFLAEYSPSRHRALFVNLMFIGFSAGASCGGFAAAMLMKDFGWRSIFVIGGLVPLAIGLALLGLPESIRFVASKRRDEHEIKRILQRVKPGFDLSRLQVADDQGNTRKQSGLKTLFLPQYRAGSFLLWITYFMALVYFYGLTNWLPTLMAGAGATIERASLTSSAFLLGGSIGAIVFGLMVDRFEANLVAGFGYASSGAIACVAAHAVRYGDLFAALVFAMGFLESGALTSMPAIAAVFYPTDGRASGVAWMLGMGRFGAIVGVAGAAPLVSAGFTLSSMLYLLLLPASIAGMAMLMKKVLPTLAPKPVFDSSVVG